MQFVHNLARIVAIAAIALSGLAHAQAWPS
jgi:hypothetical protein